MALPLKRLAQGALSASADTLYTCPAATTAVVKSLTLTNTTASLATASVYLVPSGASPSLSNVLLCDVEIDAKGFVDMSITHALAPGDTLRAAGLGVTLTASGVEA